MNIFSFFPSKRIYLDWAAGAPVSPVAVRAFAGALGKFGNPSSPHMEGVRAKEALEDARTVIARLAAVRTAGVSFTSGATEANNLTLLGQVMALRDKGEQSMHVLYLPSAHASVIETMRALEKWGVATEAIDLARLREQLRPETRLVVMDAVCGETGTTYDTRSIRMMLETYARETGNVRPMLHVDASQAPQGMPWSLTRLGADTLSIDAQKVGGVRGVGALFLRSHVCVSSLMHGGGQEGGRRPGTEPVALAVAFAAALTEAEEEREDFIARARNARARLIDTIAKEIPDAVVNQGREGVPHILNLSFPGRDTDYLVMLLDKEGFAVATKSACETDSEQGSRAVLTLTGDEERAKATLRISWGPRTRVRDLDRFAAALVRAVRFLDTPV